MATFDKLYRAEHWQYRAEGNANLVLQYTGPEPCITTTLLRLRKTDRQIPTVAPVSNKNTSGISINSNVAKKADLVEEPMFVSKVMGLLLGQEFVEQLIPVSLPADFMRELAERIELSRPADRLKKGIDFSQTVGFLALDHTKFIKPCTGQPSVAVEIKPKWGFLPQSPFIPQDLDIKRRKCRFCMYQHSKMKSGQEETLSEFCPVDLCSGNELLVRNALNSLVKTPQNNLRLFIDGRQQPISADSILRCFSGTSSVDKEKSDRAMDNAEVPQELPLMDLLAQILTQSLLLKRLARLQEGLDSLDVHTIHRFYVQLVDPITNTLQQPTFEEFLNTAETFLYRTDMDEMMSKDHKAFLSNNVSSLGFGPEDDLDDPDTVPTRLKLHFIREFLLSMTLKDCSILVTIRRDERAEETKGDRCRAADNQQVASAKADIPVFSEDCHGIKFGDQNFTYKITCIDLDPKKVNSIPMQLKKDRDLVDHYLSTVGEREASCGSR
ncbi:inositol-pentakisphosphate 2-kinase [Dissophora ornata]|nr:inositol-pentakisphosphate 2-kinase [Dissophora ornata]